MIDAIMAPVGYAGGGPSAERLGRLAADFSELLGGGPVYVRLQGGSHFLTARPDDTLYFPRIGPRSGEPRYRWEDRADGISCGYLRAEG